MAAKKPEITRTVSDDEGRRNLFLRIPQTKKERLKQLSKQSGMTMEAYASAVLEDAINNGDLFTFIKVRKENHVALPS